MVNLDDYKDLFVSESRENLDRMNTSLLRLEKVPGDTEAMKDLFRASHTIKGMAATMGFDPITHVAHGLENLLDRYRREKKQPEQAIIDLSFRTVDALSSALVAVERGAEMDPQPELLAAIAAAETGQPVRPVTPTTGAMEEAGGSSEMEEYRGMFVSESREHLQAVNTAILGLEKNPGDAVQLAEFFRAAHTMKGMAATMGFDSITALTHMLESVLDHYRKRNTPIEPPVLDISFETVDLLTNLVEQVAGGSHAPTAPAHAGLMARLELVRAAGAQGKPIPVESIRPPSAPPSSAGAPGIDAAFPAEGPSRPGMRFCSSETDRMTVAPPASIGRPSLTTTFSESSRRKWTGYFPSVISSPSVSGACVIRAPLTRVPLRLPRSTTTYSSPLLTTLACCLEIP